MPTDHAAALAAAEAEVEAANARVTELRARLADEAAASRTEQTGPRLATWADGVAAARLRHPGRTRGELADAGTNTRTGTAGYDGDEANPYIQRTPAAEGNGPAITSVEGAKAEARRRGAMRKGDLSANAAWNAQLRDGGAR